MAAGILVLVAQWAILAEITYDVPNATTIALGVAGVVCSALAVVYITRAADDLPTFFPGYDSGSENFQLIPGIISLTVGAAAIATAIASVHPTRTHHQHHGT